MIKCTNLTKTFGGKLGFQKVNLEVRPGEFLALIGPSGAGKSTLLRCLAALDQSNSGTLVIDQDVYDYSNPHAKHRDPWPTLTAVFQQLHLWPHLTVKENLDLVIESAKGRTSARAIEEFSELLGLTKFLDRYPSECSVGERQRGALARALVLKPRYLLLDEITSALDIEYVSRVVEILLSLKKERVAVIAVTHSIALARRCADKFCFMDLGEIVEQGEASLLNSPKEFRLKEFLKALEFQTS